MIGAFYRHPSSKEDVLEQLNISLSKIDRSEVPDIWLAGDFNLSGIDWPTQSTQQNCPKPGLCRQLINITNDHGLEQIVAEPTWRDNILDLFFTNNETLVEKCMVVPGISNHDGIPVVTINIKPKITKSKPRKIFIYHKANHDQIKRDLTNMKQDFESLDTDHLTVGNLWAKFSDEIKQTMDDNIPSKIVRGGKVSPWINHKIKRKQKQKLRAYNHAKTNQDPDDWDKFRSIRKNVTRETRYEYRKYIKEVCIQGNKKFWSFVKSLEEVSAGIPTLKDETFTLVPEIFRKQGC